MITFCIGFTIIIVDEGIETIGNIIITGFNYCPRYTCNNRICRNLCSLWDDAMASYYAIISDDGISHYRSIDADQAIIPDCTSMHGGFMRDGTMCADRCAFIGTNMDQNKILQI